VSRETLRAGNALCQGASVLFAASLPQCALSHRHLPESNSPLRSLSPAPHAANAVYGFCATKVSPLQCPEAADSCLAYGVQSCRCAAGTAGSQPLAWAVHTALRVAHSTHLQLATCWLQFD